MEYTGSRFSLNRGMERQTMDQEMISAARLRLDAIEVEATRLRQLLEGASLSAGDRAYISRCFDLLTMEVDAVRQFLGSVA